MTATKRFVESIGCNVVLVPRRSLRGTRAKRYASVHRESAAAIPPTPASCDWTKNRTLQFPIQGNDREGDCFEAAEAHFIGAVTGNVGKEIVYTADQVLQVYHDITGPGDNGTSSDQIFPYMEQTGYPNGQKIIDYMDVPPADAASVQAAIYFFGGVTLTIGIPDAWLNASPQQGSIWDAGPGVTADDANGHAIYLPGYGGLWPQGYGLETWGFDLTITPAGVAAADAEIFAVWTDSWFDPSTHKAPNGYTRDQLAWVWQAMGGKPIPGANPIPPTPNPTPTPIPPSPIPPSPVPPSPIAYPTYRIDTATWLATPETSSGSLKAELAEAGLSLKIIADVIQLVDDIKAKADLPTVMADVVKILTDLKA